MENNYNEVENLKEQIYDLQMEHNVYVIKHLELKRELEKKIAMLQDGFEFQKDMADLYAKKLKEVWDFLDDLQKRYDEYDDIIYPELEKIKKSIPESALERAE
jgi:pyrroloquinoline quinone (PQQ) biosynthesis protein C